MTWLWNPEVDISTFWTIFAIFLFVIYIKGIIFVSHVENKKFNLLANIKSLSDEKYAILKLSFGIALFTWTLLKVLILGFLFLALELFVLYVTITKMIEMERELQQAG